jgi:hypothetical protein
MPQSPQCQPQAGAPEPVKRPRTPPVIIRDSGRWTEVSKLLSNSRIQFTKAKQCAEGIRVTLSGVDHFRAATRLLEKHRVPFHTFTLESEKSIRVVLKPVPREISVEEITEDLQAQGFPPDRRTPNASSHFKERAATRPRGASPLGEKNLRSQNRVLSHRERRETTKKRLGEPVPQLSVVPSLAEKLPRRAAMREMWQRPPVPIV